MKRGNVTMFGKHFEVAEATVLFSEFRNGGSGYATFEVILDVRTQDGQTFRTSIKQVFLTYLQPRVGDVVKVQYAPKSKKVKIITKGDARYDLHIAARTSKAKHDAILTAPAGTPLPGVSWPQIPDRASLREKERTENARLELEEQKKLRDELLLSGSEGMATVLRIWERGAAVPPLVRYVLKVEVRPGSSDAPFTRSLRTFLDPKTHTIAAGSTVPVRYDPQDTSRIILQDIGAGGFSRSGPSDLSPL